MIGIYFTDMKKTKENLFANVFLSLVFLPIVLALNGNAFGHYREIFKMILQFNRALL